METGTRKRWRVASHKLGAERLGQPVDVVRWLGGIQAQDYRWARWAIGLRAEASGEQEVEQSIEQHQIVRTWLLRGTLHLVAAEDIGWLTALLAPGIIRGNARRYRQLGLDDAILLSSQKVMRRALQRQPALTRAEIAAVLRSEGLPAEGQQVPYLLQRAALDGLICHGLQRGHEPEYVLVADWIEAGPAFDREEALGRLAARYLAGHGPATRQDLAWWAGLSATEARTAIALAPGVRSIQVAGVEYWVVGDPPAATEPSAALLPRFDEYLIGYQDRSLVLDPAYARRVNAGGGMPRPTVMVEGEIVGVWGYEEKKGAGTVSIDPFEPLTAARRAAIERAADRLARYTAHPIDLQVRPLSSNPPDCGTSSTGAQAVVS